MKKSSLAPPVKPVTKPEGVVTVDLEWLRAKVDEVSLKPREFRKHLGASELGKECHRQVFYKFRWMVLEEVEPRMQRLFDRGEREEAIMIDLIRRTGATVYAIDGATAKQYRVSDFEGHFGGALDSIVVWPNCDPANLEGKTYNEERFRKLKKEGVRVSAPTYYSQMQDYMGHMKLAYTLFFAVNKNDDEIYYEIIFFDAAEFDRLQSLAGAIIMAERPPAKISEKPTFYICKMCAAHDICHLGKPALVNCRSCRNAHPAPEGQWVCALGKPFGTVCAKHDPIR